MQKSKEEGLVEATAAVLLGCRAMMGVAARCLPETAEVTLPQYRALVLLATHGVVNLNRLAELLDVDPSTATRLCDRLVRKDLIQREPGNDSRREVRLTLSLAGSALVRQVMSSRRKEIASILRKVSPRQRRQLTSALPALAAAAGEAPELAWAVGWLDEGEVAVP